MEPLAAAALTGQLPCRCGRCSRIGTRTVGLGRDLAGMLQDQAAGRPILLVGDPNTLEACGTALAMALGARGLQVTILDTGALHADQAAVDRVAGTLAPDTLPVAVGSGTVNDVVKAAAGARDIRYVAVATAASMNGYTSAIAAITVDGLKRTLPADPPAAVFADPDVLAAAPRKMAVSGLADLLSKPVSSADWRLSHILWNDPWCPSPAAMVESGVMAAAGAAAGIAGGDPDAVGILFDALLVSGFSMATAGSSTPASGGEHLISHFLDMTAPYEPGGPRVPALHGEQVGVATRFTTRLYRETLGREPAWEQLPEPASPDEELRAVPWIPDTLRDLFLKEARAKLDRIGDFVERVVMIRDCWSRLKQDLEEHLTAADRFRSVLDSIGGPARPEDLGVSPERYRTACRLARWVRNRYSILDLAGDLGIGDIPLFSAKSGMSPFY